MHSGGARLNIRGKTFVASDKISINARDHEPGSVSKMSERHWASTQEAAAVSPKSMLGELCKLPPTAEIRQENTRYENAVSAVQ